MATSAASAAARHLPRGLCPATALIRSPSILAPPSCHYTREQTALVVFEEQRRVFESEQQLAVFAELPTASASTSTSTTASSRSKSTSRATQWRKVRGGAPGLPGKYFSPKTGGMLMFADPLQEGQPKDPNRANLGKTLRILQERMPTLLQSPLPQDILSPQISLHLFPSTHPHLPTVSGRVAYNAALWTSPIAWNRVPLVGNVRLQILSERMTREALPFGGPHRTGAVPEKLMVRWTTMEKDGAAGDKDKKEFTGLFIFQFDTEGRVLSHTIEHAQTGDGWEKGVGARVVGLTDWLLGGMRGDGQPSGA